jgi:hypothetical protein
MRLYLTEYNSTRAENTTLITFQFNTICPNSTETYPYSTKTICDYYSFYKVYYSCERILKQKNMNHKKTITGVMFLFLGIGSIHAQENVTASGGEGTGTGGTVSYSIGQIVYTTNTGSNGSVSQGVQQTYSIMATDGIEESTINAELSIFPNPTTDNLTLSIVGEIDNVNYQLVDLQGKVIKSEKTTTNSTSINMENLAGSIYFLKVTDNNKTIKTFKIIKN